MIGNPVEPLERADFLRLASVCGLRLSPTDLFQLERHKLLCALDVRGGSGGVDPDGTYYCALHLYILATYLDGVRAYRHPWSSISGEREHEEIELDELGARCRELNGLVVGLSRGNEGVDSEGVAQLALDIERYAHGVDPFGPLSGIVDMMRADVVEKLRGAGRLYGELRRMAASLAFLAEHLEGQEGVGGVGVVTKATTQELVGVGAGAAGFGGEVRERTSSAVRERITREAEPPTIAISIDEVPVDDVRRTQLIERIEGAEALSEAKSFSSESFEDEDPIGDALSVGRFEEVVESREREGTDAPGHGFGRHESATSRTMDLNARLERLRRQDREVAGRVEEMEVEAGLDEALSEALDGAVEDVLDGALGEMLGDVDRAEETIETAEMAEVSSALLEDDLFADEDLVGDEASEAVVLEDDLFDPRFIGDEASDAVLLENELLDDSELADESSDVVLLEEDSANDGLEFDSEVLEQGPGYSNEELADKIAELNQLREQYLAAQAWSQLVELYEDGIGLFVDSNERQQVYLVLATLYEIKLKEKGRAMDSFIRAFGEVGNQVGTDKALAGMMRLGPSPEVHDGYLANLEEQLAGELADEDRRYLQRFHALALYGAGEHQRAFLLYASILAENPDENINPVSLGDLELLGEKVDIEEVLDFYHDILEQNVRPEIRQWVQNRVEAL